MENYSILDEVISCGSSKCTHMENSGADSPSLLGYPRIVNNLFLYLLVTIPPRLAGIK